MNDLEKFKSYLELEEQLTKVATKEDLLQCARLLAINVAHYQLNFGTLPLEETLLCLEAETPNDEQLAMLNLGMETFVGLLGNLMQGLETKTVN